MFSVSEEWTLNDIIVHITIGEYHFISCLFMLQYILVFINNHCYIDNFV